VTSRAHLACSAISVYSPYSQPPRKILIVNVRETSEDLFEDFSQVLIMIVIDKYGHGISQSKVS